VPARDGGGGGFYESGARPCLDRWTGSSRWAGLGAGCYAPVGCGCCKSRRVAERPGVTIDSDVCGLCASVSEPCKHREEHAGVGVDGRVGVTGDIAGDLDGVV
jgi:hypothetical protein